MSSVDDLRSWLFRSMMFEADAERFRTAGIRVGADQSQSESQLLEDLLAPFGVEMRNNALRMSRLYALMFCFENSVRELIESRLAEDDLGWWDSEKVPQKIRRNADSRQKEAVKNSWLEGETSKPFEFVDFGGLAEIIICNWDMFADLIPSQHWLKQRFDELEKTRNFIAHHRNLLDPEFRRIEMYIGDWNKQVGL